MACSCQESWLTWRADGREPLQGDDENLTNKPMDEPPEKRSHDTGSNYDDNNPLRCVAMVAAPVVTLLMGLASHRSAPEAFFIGGSAAGCGMVFAVRLVCSRVSVLLRVVAFLFALVNGFQLWFVLNGIARWHPR